MGKKRVGNDKYPLEACATGCYPLRQYCYWGSLLSIQKGSLCQLRGIGFDFGRLSFRVMIHLHTGTRMDSLFSYVVGWKADVWMPFSGIMCPEMHIMLVYRLILELLGGFGLIRMCTVHPAFPFWDFVGISSANPHETLLVHLGYLFCFSFLRFCGYT